MLAYTFLFDSLADELHLLNRYLIKEMSRKEKYSELCFFTAFAILARKLVCENGDLAMPSKKLVVSMLTGVLSSYNSKHCAYPLRGDDMDGVIDKFLATYVSVVKYKGLADTRGAIEAGEYILQEVFRYKSTDKNELEYIGMLLFRLAGLFLTAQTVNKFNKERDISRYEFMFDVDEDDTPIVAYAKYIKYRDSLIDRFKWREDLLSEENVNICATIALAYLQASKLMDENLFV